MLLIDSRHTWISTGTSRPPTDGDQQRRRDRIISTSSRCANWPYMRYVGLSRNQIQRSHRNLSIAFSVRSRRRVRRTLSVPETTRRRRQGLWEQIIIDIDSWPSAKQTTPNENSVASCGAQNGWCWCWCVVISGVKLRIMSWMQLFSLI